MSRLLSILCAAGLLAAPGCYENDFDPFNPLGQDLQEEAAPALDAVELMQAEAALLAAGFGASETLPDTGDGIATRVAAEVDALFTPAGCLTATAEGAALTLAFNGCQRGPRGLTAIDGTYVMTYTVSGGTVSTTIQSAEVSASGATQALQATATFTSDGAERQLTITTQSSGSGTRNKTLARNGVYTSTWSTVDDCVQLSGSYQVAQGSDVSQLVVTDYARCGATCPSRGSVTWQAASGSGSASQIVLSFNGTDTVEAIGTGAIEDVSLACQP